MIKEFLNKIIHTDALSGLKLLPDGCVDMVCTSPPYYGLRNYSVDKIKWAAFSYTIWGLTIEIPEWTGCLGLEPTPQMFVGHLVMIMNEVRRVLKPSGVAFVNIGDSYASKAGGYNVNGSRGANAVISKGTQSAVLSHKKRTPPIGIKEKDLMGIPWLLSFALRDAGWYLRQDVIWSKGNTVPESVLDRCTKSHEYIFHLSKSKIYYHDAEAIKEPSKEPEDDRGARKNRKRFPTKQINGIRNSGVYPMANKRSVWQFNTSPFPDAHFATFPEELPELCVKAGSSEHGCCSECGKPWKRILKKSGQLAGRDRNHGGRVDGKARPAQWENGQNPTSTATVGWQPSCTCFMGGGGISTVVPAVVLDPFSGSNTTGATAKKLGRDFISFEMNPDYIKIAEKRMGKEFGMFL